LKYCWEEGIKSPMAENCLECNETYNNRNLSKGVCFNDGRPTYRDHREFNNQRVSVHHRLGGKASIHDWLEARPMFMIDWESQTIGWKRRSILWSLMKISCAELLNVDACCNWTMKGQAKHVRSPIHNGVQMA
jgi:hypothetical protein